MWICCSLDFICFCSPPVVFEHTNFALRFWAKLGVSCSCCNRLFVCQIVAEGASFSWSSVSIEPLLSWNQSWCLRLATPTTSSAVVLRVLWSWSQKSEVDIESVSLISCTRSENSCCRLSLTESLRRRSASSFLTGLGILHLTGSNFTEIFDLIRLWSVQQFAPRIALLLELLWHRLVLWWPSLIDASEDTWDVAKRFSAFSSIWRQCWWCIADVQGRTKEVILRCCWICLLHACTWFEAVSLSRYQRKH